MNDRTELSPCGNIVENKYLGKYMYNCYYALNIRNSTKCSDSSVYNPYNNMIEKCQSVMTGAETFSVESFFYKMMNLSVL